MKLGDSYSTQNQPAFAASAFLLAEMPWRAAQTYISSKNVPAAIDIINTTPIFSQDKNKATRNLAKYAFDNNHPTEAAYLLQSIGAEDEAVAVLIAAGQNSNILNQFQGSGNRSSNTNRVTPVSTSANLISRPERTPSIQSTEPHKLPSTAQKVESKNKEQPSAISSRSEVSGSSPFFI